MFMGVMTKMYPRHSFRKKCASAFESLRRAAIIPCVPKPLMKENYLLANLLSCRAYVCKWILAVHERLADRVGINGGCVIMTHSKVHRRVFLPRHGFNALLHLSQLQ